jgi:hypothetical protein
MKNLFFIYIFDYFDVLILKIIFNKSLKTHRYYTMECGQYLQQKTYPHPKKKCIVILKETICITRATPKKNHFLFIFNKSILFNS